MRVRDEAAFEQRKKEIMEACYNCYAENGLHGTGVSALAKAAGLSKAGLYVYFEDLDDLIVQSTEYCMSKVEDDFMALSPRSPDDIVRFLDEVPYWTARKHGKKYRLMYQVYTHPKYIEHGKKFFEGVNRRYAEYSASLENKLGIPSELLTPIIFILIRACVHYALFEDEFYLKTQMAVLKKGLRMFMNELNGQKQADTLVAALTDEMQNSPAPEEKGKDNGSSAE